MQYLRAQFLVWLAAAGHSISTCQAYQPACPPPTPLHSLERRVIDGISAYEKARGNGGDLLRVIAYFDTVLPPIYPLHGQIILRFGTNDSPVNGLTNRADLSSTLEDRPPATNWNLTLTRALPLNDAAAIPIWPCDYNITFAEAVVIATSGTNITDISQFTISRTRGGSQETIFTLAGTGPGIGTATCDIGTRTRERNCTILPINDGRFTKIPTDPQDTGTFR